MGKWGAGFEFRTSCSADPAHLVDAHRVGRAGERRSFGHFGYCSCCARARPHPSLPPQVIIIQPQVQTQPESSAEPRPPMEEPSQGAQASKRKKEDPAPSQESPEVGSPCSGPRLWVGLSARHRWAMERSCMVQGQLSSETHPVSQLSAAQPRDELVS